MNGEQFNRIEALLIEAVKADTWAGTREKARMALLTFQAEYVLVHGVAGIQANGVRSKASEAAQPAARLETSSENIARDIREGYFPKRSEPQMVSDAAPQPASEPGAAVAAIRYALNADEGIEFLRCWQHGQFDVCRNEWPDAPKECYAGADPLLAMMPQPASEQQAALTNTEDVPLPITDDRGWHELAYVLDQLRETGTYTDEEGEGIHALEDLLRAAPISVLQWAIGRWNAEVKDRPLVNIHRRTLDDTWRQVIRHCGGDPDALVGPNHSALLAAKGDGHV